MSSVTVKLEGFKELEAELDKLSKRTGRAAMRRALMDSAEPLARKMRSMAPKGEDMDLSESIDVSTKLSKRQARLHKKMFRNDKAAAEVFVGAGPDRAADNQEFGNRRHGAQPFARPAWEQDKMALLERLKVELWDSISAAIRRSEARRR